MNCDNEQDRTLFSKVYDVLSRRLLYFEKESHAVFVWHLIEQAKKQKSYPHAVKYLSQIVESQTSPKSLAILVRKLFCNIGVTSELLQFQDKIIVDFEENFDPNLSTVDIWRKCRTTEIEMETRLLIEKKDTEELNIRKKERMDDFETLKRRSAARGQRLSNVTRTRAPFIKTKRTPLQDSTSVIDLKINVFADIFLTTQALFLFDEEAAHYLHACLIVEKMANASIIRKGKDNGNLDEEKLNKLLSDYLYWLFECRKKFRVHELCVMLSTTAYGTTSQYNNVYFAAQEMCADEDKYGKLAVMKSGRKKSRHRPTEFSPLDHGGARIMAILAYESYIKLLADFRALQEQVFKKNIAAYNMSTIYPPLRSPSLNEVEIPDVLSGIDRYVKLESVPSPKEKIQRSSEISSSDSGKPIILERRKSSSGRESRSKNKTEIFLPQPHLSAENNKPSAGADQEVKSSKNVVLSKTRQSLRSRGIGHGVVPLESGFYSMRPNATNLSQPKHSKSQSKQLLEYDWNRTGTNESLTQNANKSNVWVGRNHHSANYEFESGPTQTPLKGNILDYPDDFYGDGHPLPNTALADNSLSVLDDLKHKSSSSPGRPGNDMVTSASGRAKEVAVDLGRQSPPDMKINRNEEKFEEFEVRPPDMGSAMQYPQTYRPSAPENEEYAKGKRGNDIFAPTDPRYQDSLTDWLLNAECKVALQDLDDAVSKDSSLDEVVGNGIQSSKDRPDQGNTQNKTRISAKASTGNGRLGYEEVTDSHRSGGTDRTYAASGTIGKSPTVHSRIPASENYPRQEENIKKPSNIPREDAANEIVNFDIDTAFMDEDCNEIFDISKNLEAQKTVKPGWDNIEQLLNSDGSGHSLSRSSEGKKAKARAISLQKESPEYKFDEYMDAIDGLYNLDPEGFSPSGSSEGKEPGRRTKHFQPESPEYQFNEDMDALYDLYNLDPNGYSFSGSSEGKEANPRTKIVQAESPEYKV